MGASPGAPRTVRGMAAMGAARTQLRSTDRRSRTSLRGLARIGWCTLVLAALATLALPVAPAHAAPDGLRTTEVAFVGNGGVVLPGTVLAPAGSTRRRTGLVMRPDRYHAKTAVTIRPTASAIASRAMSRIA